MKELDDYLRRVAPPSVERFLPKDDDELNDALCVGRFDRVVFADLADLMEAVWKGEAQLERWAAAGVRIEVACPPTQEPDAWRNVIDATYDSLCRWRKRERRRQSIAAAILSAIALIAMGVLFFLIPPPR